MVIPQASALGASPYVQGDGKFYVNVDYKTAGSALNSVYFRVKDLFGNAAAGITFEAGRQYTFQMTFDENSTGTAVIDFNVNVEDYNDDAANHVPLPQPMALGTVGFSQDGQTVTYRQMGVANLGATLTKSIADQLLFPSAVLQNGMIADKAAAANFYPIFGSLYQWGRKSDGHQNVWSATVSTQASDAENTDDRFVMNYSWLNPARTDLWQFPGTDINDPCPAGYHVPTQDEWSGILTGQAGNQSVSTSDYKGINHWVWVTIGTDFVAGVPEITNANPVATSGYLLYPPKNTAAFPRNATDYTDYPTLFLPSAGIRNSYSNTFNTNHDATYWSSTVAGGSSACLLSDAGSIKSNSSAARSYGLPVRCIANN
jgi:hypothetical protein